MKENIVLTTPFLKGFLDKKPTKPTQNLIDLNKHNKLKKITELFIGNTPIKNVEMLNSYFDIKGMISTKFFEIFSVSGAN